MTLLLDCSLSSAADIAAPIVGTGAGAAASPSTTFVAGRAVFNAKEDSVKFQQSDGVTVNVSLARGRLELHDFTPKFLDSSTEKLVFCSVGTWENQDSRSMWAFGKHNNSNANRLWFIYYDASGNRHETTYDTAVWKPTLNKDVPCTVATAWDWTAPEGVSCVRLYVDGVELVPHSYSLNGEIQEGAMSGPQSHGTANPAEFIWVGNRQDGDAFRANAHIGGIRIYDCPEGV